MNYRQASLLAAEDATTAGTKTVDLDIADIISRIQVKYDYTNGSHDATAHPAKTVSKIEVVDGSMVLYSLSGSEIEALDFFDSRRSRPYELEYRSGVIGQLVFNLNFGRKLYDPLLALDPKKFTNPQLKISHNKALGGSAPSASQLRVVADVFDEKKVTPQGFLMAKEHHLWTLTNNAYEDVDLPTDYPLRKLLVKTQTDTAAWFVQLAEMKLSEDNDKRIPVNITAMEDYVNYVRNLFGQYIEQIVGTFSGVASRTWYGTPTARTALLHEGIGTATRSLDAEFAGQAFAMTPSAVHVWRGLLHGWEPHGAAPIIFGDQDDIADWYDVTKIGSVKLRVKAGGSVVSNSTAEIVTQQLRKYA